jgi:hypothetical protein
MNKNKKYDLICEYLTNSIDSDEFATKLGIEMTDSIIYELNRAQHRIESEYDLSDKEVDEIIYRLVDLV